MKKSELKKLIKEVYLKEAFNNTPDPNVAQMMQMFEELDAESAELFFVNLGVFFVNNRETLNNMNTQKISDHILSIVREYSVRTSN
jgi:hypothetical protein